MPISDLGSLGEFISSVVVLVTLIYLALQIRQNTRATRATSHHAITDALNQFNLTLAANDGVAKIWHTGMNDRAALDEVQRDQYDALIRAYMHVCDTMYYQAQVGAGDRGLWKAEERYLGVILTSNGGKEWWQENYVSISTDFRIAVDEIIQRYQSSESDQADALAARYGSSL
ncbi:MAG: hypothetical protein O7H39_00270 [Gammaproteobacteria bacterium]|nr:hypothetical protein [Gammaproteobacteria bacterium]